MALPELFRHRDRFVGCIAIGRVARRRVGERVQTGAYGRVLDHADVAAFDALEDALLHRSPLLADESFSIATQGFDYPSLARCPALADDGLCAIHTHGKPSMCEAVPLDPMVPDSMQDVVLAARNASSAYVGANCIREGEAAARDRDGCEGAAAAARDDADTRTHMVTLVANGRIQDASSQGAVQRRRSLLTLDREFWGRAVFELLRGELFDSPVARMRIPTDGYLTISLVPALLAVASYSDACRVACVAYIDSQLALIERNVERALQRRRPDDRPVTRELRAFSDAYAHAKDVLAHPQRMSDNTAPDVARRVESWLGA
jgi:hypothetical protein